MTCRRTTLPLLPLLAAPLLIAATADHSAAFQFMKNLVLPDPPPTANQELLAVPLDREVAMATRDGFPDLRLLGPDHQELPFHLERASHKRRVTSRRSLAATVVNLEELPGNQLRLVIRRNRSSGKIAGIQLRTPLTDFERRISVSGSRDGQQWTPLVPDALIYDYSRFMDVRRTEIPLPDNDFSHFSLLIEQVVDEAVSPLRELLRKTRPGQPPTTTELSAVLNRPLRLDSVTFWSYEQGEEIAEPVIVERPLPPPRVSENSERQETVIEVAAGREPLTSLILTTTSRNFRREVVIEVERETPHGAEWQHLTAAPISLLAFGEHRESSLEIDFAETRANRYRLRIANHDSPPLQITGIAGRGPVYHLLFLKPASGTLAELKLFYGSEQVPQPRYDLAAVLAMAGRGLSPAFLTLGPQQPNPVAGPVAFSPARFLASPWFLGSALVVMVVVLALVVFRTARRVVALPPDESP